jgi:hypothetical protein
MGPEFLQFPKIKDINVECLLDILSMTDEVHIPSHE